MENLKNAAHVNERHFFHHNFMFSFFQLILSSQKKYSHANKS